MITKEKLEYINKLNSNLENLNKAIAQLEEDLDRLKNNKSPYSSIAKELCGRIEFLSNDAKILYLESSLNTLKVIKVPIEQEYNSYILSKEV